MYYVNLTYLLGSLVIIATSVLAYMQMHVGIIFLFTIISSVFFIRKGFPFFIFINVCFLTLLPFETVPSSFLYNSLIHVIDPIVFIFLIFLLFTKKNQINWNLLKSSFLLFFVSFFIYNFIKIFSFSTFEGFYYGIQDMRKFFYVFLTIYLFLIFKKKYKKILIFFLLIIFFTNISGIINSAGFFYRHYIMGLSRISSRQLCQISFLFSQCIILSVIGLSYFKNKKIRIFLYISLIINISSLIIDQTRGLWISTTFSLLLYFALYKKIKNLFKILIYTAITILTLFTLLLSLKINILNIIIERFGDIKPHELINPLTSLGYRIYESLKVLENATFFGHGLRAPLYLFQPWDYKFGNWYGIHNQYFEIIHFTGFFGLILFILFLSFFIKKAFIISKNSKQSIHLFFGKICLITIINTSIVSITSGFFFRFVSSIFLGYLFVLMLLCKNSN